MLWKQYLDYRGLEGMARSLKDLRIIPEYGDYTTIWYRIHDLKPGLDISGVRIRSDNGTQLVSRIVELSLSSLRIEHERIHPGTPKEDAHIESFNSILEKEVVRRFEFSSFSDAENTIDRFTAFYNNERLHSAIGYKAPKEVYEEWKKIH